MAPTRQPARNKATTGSSTSANEEGNPSRHESRGSQGSDDHIVKNMADALKKSTKKRRDAQRSKIEKEYYLEMEQLQKSAVTNLNRIASQISKKQWERLKILKNLLTMRAAIETEILRSTATLENAFLNANKELRIVLTSGLRRLKEAEVSKE